MKKPLMDVGPKIRAYRKRKGFSLNEVSRLTGIAASTLSAIELDKSSPTLATLIKISAAFGLKVGAFVDEALYAKAVFCHAGEGQPLDTHERGVTVRSLTHGLLLNRMQAVIVTLEPGTDRFSLDGKGSDRFLYCLSGEAIARVDEATYVLHEGDSLYVMAEAATEVTSTARQSTILALRSDDRG